MQELFFAVSYSKAALEPPQPTLERELLKGGKDSSKWRFVTTHHGSFLDVCSNKRTYLAHILGNETFSTAIAPLTPYLEPNGNYSLNCVPQKVLF